MVEYQLTSNQMFILILLTLKQIVNFYFDRGWHAYAKQGLFALTFPNRKPATSNLKQFSTKIIN